MADRELSRRRTQINDLPSCLTIDILSRVPPIETLVNSRFVCKSWFVLFSDPLFVRLHSARSPTCLLNRVSRLKMDLKRYKPVGEMAGKDLEIDGKISIPDSRFICCNSCHGLLCLIKDDSVDEIYVCNPILGEYITIPIVKSECSETTKYVLGFSSRSNQFKVLRLHPSENVLVPAEIYTIGNGTREWKSIGIAPRCITSEFPESPVNSFLNGSIHWPDGSTHQIVYFDFESEQFGSLPSPPAWGRDGRWSKFSRVKVGVLDGCLCIHASGYQNAPEIVEKWAMKEYGVEESWTKIFSTHAFECELHYSFFPTRTAYNPSFISLQDVAKSEHLTVISRTRTKDQDSLELISNHIFELWE